MVDIYGPDFVSVTNGNSITFDGSASSTNKALITSLSAGFDAQIFIERSNDNGSTWQECSQLTDANGNDTFSADWHSQGNRILVSSGLRRIRIDNVDSASDVTEVIGDEV
jgi:hypothetical protein